MISKSDLKKINSLKFKKYRQKYGLFVAEGAKIVKELIISKHQFLKIYATKIWYDENKHLIINFKQKVEIIDENFLNKISFLKTPNQVLAIVNLPENNKIPEELHSKKTTLIILDGISDPGNLGTILRIADWYGVSNILCYNNCVDIYHPTVVQSSMGSIFHIKVYQNSESINLSDFKNRQTVATCLNGTTEWEDQLESDPVFIIGNESHGLSENILSQASIKATIKKYGKAESLNAAIATAIVLDRWRGKFLV